MIDSEWDWKLCGCPECDCQYVQSPGECEACGWLTHFERGPEINWLARKKG